MDKKLFGALVASAVANLAANGIAFGETNAKVADKADSAKPGKEGAHCVHDCAGHATCKGHGNANCAGQNQCAGQGGVPKECSSQTNQEGCQKVLDKKNNRMCTWLTEK